ncbi:MAG TPA: hypothetical protein VF933_20495 [Streptosporangiaceae bacterium]
MTVQTTTTSPAGVDLARFEAAVDPDGTLPPEDRRRRAEHARNDRAERIGRLMRELGAALGELVELAATYGYELPDAVRLAAAVMPRPGEPDPEPTPEHSDWLALERERR